MTPPARLPHGFTLLEILVVLAIVGLLAGVALPQLQRLLGSVELSSQRTDIRLAIEGLGYRAYAAGKPITLADAERSTLSGGAAPPPNEPLQLPPGWQIKVATPIVYSLNGVCGGGRLSIINPEGRRENFQLRPPKCQLEPVEASECSAGNTPASPCMRRSWPWC